MHANVGFVGIGYTGEIADMISLKGEFSYLFGRADLSNWGDERRCMALPATTSTSTPLTTMTC